MVIVPTEKQFDWQHAPLVLIVIVLLNILIFFLYQSNDEAKLETGITTYMQADILPLECPLYLEYIKSTEGEGSFQELVEYSENFEDIDFAVTLLMDQGFREYLDENSRNLITDVNYERWDRARTQVNQSIGATSALRFGLTPQHLSPVTLLTHQFLHGDTMHLLGNLFFLIVCGFAVEAALGHLRFLLFYLISGIAGGLAHALITPDIYSPLIGASGAISGVMAMYLGVFRLKKIEFFYWFFIFVGYFRAPALLILPFYIGKELFDYYGDENASIAFMAHAGGFAAGALLTLGTFFIKRDLINEEYIEENQAANPYQEKLAKVFDAIEKFQFAAALRGLNAMIDEFGLNFELSLIRFNLLKIDKGEGFQKALVELLSINSNSSRELLQQEKLWKENPQAHSTLNDKQLMQLALNFANDKQFDTAEQLFKQIVNLLKTEHDTQPSSQSISQPNKNPQLGKLALRMAKAASELKHISKQRMYQQYAESML